VVSAREVVQSPVLIGRDSQLALLEQRLADAAAGAGRLLFVAGEAGIGKTRLLGSAVRRAQRSGFAVVRAAAFLAMCSPMPDCCWTWRAAWRLLRSPC
jgi:predicted ATPase